MTAPGATTSGQELLYFPNAVEPGKPFKIRIVMLVESVSPHNPLDSAAAIMASYTSPFGTSTDRMEMIYLDSGAIGWADESQSSAFSVVDGAYHTYELSVDDSGVAQLMVDGIPALTRTGFTSNGTIAVGDQSNDANVDSALRIRPVTMLCPPSSQDAD